VRGDIHTQSIENYWSLVKAQGLNALQHQRGKSHGRMDKELFYRLLEGEGMKRDAGIFVLFPIRHQLLENSYILR